MRLRRTPMLLIAGAVLAASAALSLATVPLGTQETVSDGEGRRSSVALSTVDGRAMVTFDRGNNANDEQLFGRVLGRDGDPAGAPFSLGAPLIRNSGSSSNSAIAFNGFRNEFFVVWQQDVKEGLDDNHTEIFGQRLDPNGARIGIARRLSAMGPIDSTEHGASNPEIAYNATLDEYLVVWAGRDIRPGLGGEELEIFGQRVSGAGLPIGDDDFRISDMGPADDAKFQAFAPAVSYNPDRDEYLVVWQGDDLRFTFSGRPPQITPSLVDDEFEIFGQRLTADGTEIGGNDFRISDAGPPADPDFDARRPDVSYSTVTGQYMVVWRARDLSAPMLIDDQIYGQRLTGAGAPAGVNDFPISEAGRSGVGERFAHDAEVQASSRAAEFLVVWAGGSNMAQLTGERRDANGALLGPSDVVLGDKPRDDTSSPADLVYSPLDNRYLATWTYADQDTVNSDVIDRRLIAGAAATQPPPPPAGRPRPRIFCGGRTATIIGTSRSEVIRGTRRADIIVAGGGNDTVISGAGNDIICLGRGNDRAIAGGGSDRVFGQAGRDLLRGGRGNDLLIGGAAIDRLIGQQGNDRLLGGPGNDRINGGQGADLIRGGDGNDRARGGAGNDRIFGQRGRDVLRGQAGRDRLIGGPGRDVAIGGPGADRCSAERIVTC